MEGIFFSKTLAQSTWISTLGVLRKEEEGKKTDQPEKGKKTN